MPDTASFFHRMGARYREYRPVPASSTSREVAFWSSALPSPTSSAPCRTYLDVCCGHGRHSLEFARRGWATVGVDISEALLETGRAEARAEGLQVTLLAGDMRTFEVGAGEARFDFASILAHSFGFFPVDEENLRALVNVVRHLRRAGSFAIEVFNRRVESRRIELAPVSTRQTPSGPVLKEERLVDSGRAKLVWVHYDRTDGAVRLPYFMRLYTLAEMLGMLAAVGLKVRAVHQDHEGAPFDEAQSRSMLILAEKL